jgi:TIR domain
VLPTVPQLLDFFVRLEDDPERPRILDGSPFQIFQEAVKEGLVEGLEQDGFAWVVGKAVNRGLIGFELTQAGLRPSGPVWGDHDFQMHSCYYVTTQGRQMAELYRRNESDENDADERTMNSLDGMRDCFVCHASEDKDAVARPLADALRGRDYAVWFDEFELGLGDSLRRKIDEGLTNSRFGVVILSRKFFKKEWPQRELDGLAARETASGEKLILPVWHEIDRAFLARKSPTLADRLGVKSKPLSDAVDAIAEQLNRRRTMGG